jgi:tripartite-type tricarboxylate transporter receptor subunit TctC
MIRRNVLSLVLGAGLIAGLGLSAPAAEAAWPERPVNIIVPAAAGGGTDATGRLLAKQLQDIFKQPFNIVNQGQAGGVVGHTNIGNARPDGYTLGIIYPYAQYKLLGQADVNRGMFTPIAQFNFDPAGLHTSINSPYKTLKDALAALKANPSKFKIGCGGSCGGAWDIPVGGLLMDQGIDTKQITFIPSAGAAVSLQELAAGGLDFVSASAPEAKALIEAGKVHPLVVMSDERIGAFPNIPTVREQVGKNFEGGAWRGVAGPKGLPQDIVQAMEKALKQIYDSAEFKDAMNARGFGLRWRPASEFTPFLKEHEEFNERIMTALGMVKK